MVSTIANDMVNHQLYYVSFLSMLQPYRYLTCLNSGLHVLCKFISRNTLSMLFSLVFMCISWWNCALVVVSACSGKSTNFEVKYPRMGVASLPFDLFIPASAHIYLIQWDVTLHTFRQSLACYVSCEPVRFGKDISYQYRLHIIFMTRIPIYPERWSLNFISKQCPEWGPQLHSSVEIYTAIMPIKHPPNNEIINIHHHISYIYISRIKSSNLNFLV